MAKSPEEWLKQSDYDFDTAEFLFNSGRYFYAVYMSHLSLEKALKGICHKKLNEIPPKTHNLVFLMNKVEIVPPETVGKFLVKINEASIVTRYPEDLAQISKNHTKEIVKNILDNTKDALKWIKMQY